MPLAPATRLGSYEIVSPLGAGGMGEVYKARDLRLGRFVAIKVLPEALAESAEALARFEREAKAVAALNHPNILGIHDFATDNGTSFVVMELLEGESLRTRLEQGPIPPRRTAELAIQLAEGLAAAHEKGVVHRDLKPDNLWITRDGRLKILDFGLAKQVLAMGPRSDSYAPTEAPVTGQGTILGTLGYMSPEQVRGEAVDARSDLFSFGVVLYEMLTGRRAFQRASASDTLAAILRDDPPEIQGSGRSIPPALHRIVQHCLEKSPEQRFHSAHDVGFALRDLSFAEGAAPITAPFAPRNRRATWTWAAVGAVLVAGAAALGWAVRGGTAALPTFRTLTHERGTLSGARFVPGSPEVVYSAQWSGGTSQWYATRLDQPGTRAIAGSEGILLAVSPGGEGLGISQPYLSHAIQVGSLYTLPLAGGAPRVWESGRVWGACAGAPGELAAAIGDFGAEIRLEWPLGHVVAKGLEVARSPAIRGDLLAYVKERGNIIENVSLELVAKRGASRKLTDIDGFTGLGWGPSGKELWVSTYRDGESRFLAVDLSGKTRTLLRHAGRLELQDVDASGGRVLAALHSYQRQTFARAPGETKERDLGWLDAQATLSMTQDGKTALLAPLADWSGLNGTLYLRPLSGGPAQTIGLGQRQSTISSDGKWVTTCTLEPQLSVVVMPTGPGAARRVPIPDFEGSDLRVDLLPDEKNAILWGRRRGEPFAFYALDLATGAYRKLSPPGSSHFAYQKSISPDGHWIAYVNPGRKAEAGETVVDVSRTDGSEAHVAVTLPKGEAVCNWGPDSASLLVWDRNKVPADVDRLDLATGKRSRLLTIAPADPVGIPGIQSMQITPDGAAYTYNVTRKLSELYVIDGLR